MTQEVSGSDNLKCHICGIMFATQQEKQQHMKLEHQNKEEHWSWLSNTGNNPVFLMIF